MFTEAPAKLDERIIELREFITESIDNPGGLMGAKSKAELLAAIQLLRELLSIHLEHHDVVSVTYLTGSVDFNDLPPPAGPMFGPRDQ